LVLQDFKVNEAGSKTSGLAMKSYFYADEDNNPIGPVSGDDLVELHRTGQIEATTLVTLQEHEDWQPLHVYELGNDHVTDETSSDKSICQACGEKIKETVFGSNFKLGKKKLAIINLYHSEVASERCDKCGEGLFVKYKDMLIEEKKSLESDLRKELRTVPILSLQSPLNWDYSVCGLVTAQSTSGTGALSDLTSTFTDFFGAQSKTYNEKIKRGEEMCKAILRREAVELGGNAVIAADIDYAEVGGGRAMLMICMTGTAVLLKNPEILGEVACLSFAGLEKTTERLHYLANFVLPDF
jgi:uncharacterized protein YbjQ (UPF0145 family)